MTGIFRGNHPVYEAANIAFAAIFEGKGMVCRIIDGTRDTLVSHGMSKDKANDTVLKARQLFFDPFASPGVHPTTDPTFKKMLPAFPRMTQVLVDRYGYGTPGYDRQGAEGFAAKFVDYVKKNFPDGLESVSDGGLDRIMDAAEAGTVTRHYRPEDYYYVEVTSWTDLRRKVKPYGITDWCIVNSEHDWDKFTLYGAGRFYLLVTDDADTSDDPMSVIGIVLNGHGNLVYAFSRDNHTLPPGMADEIASRLDLLKPEPKDFGTALDMVRAGGDVSEIFYDCMDLGRGLIIVRLKDMSKGMCLLDINREQYLTDICGSIEPIRGTDLLLLDNSKIFRPGNESVLFDNTGKNLGLHMVAKARSLDNNGDAFPLYSYDVEHGKVPVNFLCLTDDQMVTGMDPSSRTPIDEVEFNMTGTVSKRGYSGVRRVGKIPTVQYMDPGDFWSVRTEKGHYIVDRPGKKLDECIFVPDFAGKDVTVLTPEGYGKITVSIPGSDGRLEYYLVKDGKKVFDRAFEDIVRHGTDDYTLELLAHDDEDCMLFHPDTGKLERYNPDIPLD